MVDTTGKTVLISASIFFHDGNGQKGYSTGTAHATADSSPINFTKEIYDIIVGECNNGTKVSGTYPKSGSEECAINFALASGLRKELVVPFVHNTKGIAMFPQHFVIIDGKKIKYSDVFKEAVERKSKRLLS